MATGDSEHLSWPIERIGEAIDQVAARAGFPVGDAQVPMPCLHADAEIGRWIEAAAAWLDIEAEEVSAPHADVAKMLLRFGPGLVCLPNRNAALAVLGRRGRRIQLLSPDRRDHSIDVQLVRNAVCDSDEEEEAAKRVEGSLEGMVLSPEQRRRARRALMRELLHDRRVGGCWQLRMPPGASIWSQARAASVPAHALWLVGLHLLQIALAIVGWALLGRAALQGNLERGWLLAWTMLLVTVIPVRLFSVSLQSELAMRCGKLLKHRLLAGALRLDPEIIRREGAGQLLGRALETNSIDNLALSAGIGALLAFVELVPAFFVLARGSGGLGHVLMLVLCVTVAIVAWLRGCARTVRWTDARRRLTHDLVERMVGHRTRLAQQDPRRWHDGEDQPLERYANLSRDVDRVELALQVLPHAWLLIGVCMLASPFVRGASPAGLAIGLGGVLLGWSAMTRIASGLMQTAAAAASYRQLAPLYHAASTPIVRPSPVIATAMAAPTTRQRPLLRATGLSFGYPGTPEPVISDATLRIDVGDRLLLEGPSGGGKSTLASLLAGLRQPTSGLLLLDGLDYRTLGADGWRARVATAPQYHDNHILSETFGFNLMLGGRWPPVREDVVEASEVCDELGLGDLLDRMPGGFNQLVGETGWRLSHGERSRVFIARALLQHAPLVVLDESLAALDPKTLERCLRCVQKRASSLLVIAHP